MERRAKIIATIGPASQDESMLEQLMLAGMNVARLNFSHGDHETHATWAKRLRAVAARLDRPLAILQDLQGPKIRVGQLPQPLTLTPDQEVWLYPQESQTPPETPRPAIPVDFRELFTAVRAGDRILLDDGRLELQVKHVAADGLAARVRTGGVLSSHKGINLPGVKLAIPAFTEKDAADLAFGLSLGVEAVAISFVRCVDDVRQVQQAIAAQEPPHRPLVIAKLERPEALDQLEAILEAADGVMVARGDLGVEMAPEDVPGVQKRIIREANRQGKLVITATQMLESMIHNPLPTRAEASDVANAIFDGADAVMLSGETAVGEYPLQALQMMDRIIRQAEADFREWGRKQRESDEVWNDALAVTRAACDLAEDRDVTAVAVFTRGGRSAWLMARARPRVPVLAFTSEEYIYRQLALAWGVEAHRVPFVHTVDEMVRCIEQALRASGRVRPGQQVVLVCGYPVGELRPPNMALLHTIQGK